MAWGCAASVGRMNEDMKTQHPDADAAHKKNTTHQPIHWFDGWFTNWYSGIFLVWKIQKIQSATSIC